MLKNFSFIISLYYIILYILIALLKKHKIALIELEINTLNQRNNYIFLIFFVYIKIFFI
jgi:hypothetical protein